MMLAIRQLPAGLAPAEMELRLARIADRPMAHRLFQREDARPLIVWDEQLPERRGLGIELSLVVRLERDIAARAEHKRWRAVLARHVPGPRPRAWRARASPPPR